MERGADKRGGLKCGLVEEAFLEQYKVLGEEKGERYTKLLIAQSVNTQHFNAHSAMALIDKAEGYSLSDILGLNVATGNYSRCCISNHANNL